MKLDIFDPPLCCSSGVCGAVPDFALMRFAADLDALRKRGVEVRRHNLAQEPLAFVENPAVQAALDADEHCLPLVFADGRLVSRRTYPGFELMAEALALPVEQNGGTTRGIRDGA